MNLYEQYNEDYRHTLERFLDGAGEDALSRAYEIGRKALADGLGILDVASIHHDAVTYVLKQREPEAPAAFMRIMGNFLNDSLSPFELSYRSVEDVNAALRHLNERLEDEAKRIAHALHDQAGSILASAGLELDMAAEAISPSARERLALVRRLIDETGEHLRHLAHELRPTILDDFGLGPALVFLAQGIHMRTGLQIDVRVEFRERILPAVETAVYRIVQEALNNTLRHVGNAAVVTVTIERNHNRLHCVVADDGVGFDVSTFLVGGERRGLGLLGMRERASAVGGRCDVKSVPGRGTLIEIVVPAETPEPSER